MASAFMNRWQLVKQMSQFLFSGRANEGSILASMIGPGTRGDQLPRRRREEYLKAYSDLPWLRAIVHRIAFSVAAQPWSLYVQQGTKKIKYDAPHPLKTMLTDGIPGILSGMNIVMLTQMWWDLVGDAFWVLRRNQAGAPVEAWPIPPHWVLTIPYQITPNDQVYRLQLPNGQQAVVPATEIVWFKDIDPLNPYMRGTSTAVALGDEFSTDELAAKFVSRFFYNSARPDIIVSGDGMTPETTKRLEEEWNRKNQGVWNVFRTFFLNKKVDIKEIAQNFQHMQLIDLRKYERDTIIHTYGIPPEILGIVEHSNRATIEAADYHFGRWVLHPRLVQFDLMMNAMVHREYDPTLFFEHDHVIPEDKEFRLTAANEGLARGAMSVDEWRQAGGWDPLPSKGGQVFYVPANAIPVRVPGDEVVAGTPAPAPEPPPPPTDEPVAALPEPPKHVLKHVLKVLARDLLPNLDAMVAEMFKAMKPVYRGAIKDAGSAAMRRVSAEGEFSLITPPVARYIERTSFKKVEAITRTTRDALQATLTEGLGAGENMTDLADRISTVFTEAKGARADTIARTESISATNFGAVEGYQQSEVVDGKSWLSSRDDRVRETHFDADGQEVGLEDDFEVGGATLAYPGDPDGPPEEVINCRCTIVPIVGKMIALRRSEDACVAFWKAFDRVAATHQRIFRHTVIKVFQSQQHALIARLRRLH